MKKVNVFAARCIKEMLRDPVAYIFCLGFPIALLVAFQVILQSSGGEASWFSLGQLTPGIMIFSYTFVTLNISILVSKDKVSSLLTRLYTSPMKTEHFVLGYFIPGFIICVIQAIICFACAGVIAVVTGVSFSFWGSVLSIIASLPMAIMFVFAGILFGSLFSEKSAPGITAIFINLTGFCSGTWMPLETMGGFRTFCMFMPFYPAVRLCRMAYMRDLNSIDSSTRMLCIGLVLGYCVLISVLSIWGFGRNRKRF